MFEQLFPRPRDLERHSQGPLAEQRRAFLAHCSALGMAHLTLRAIAAYLLVVADYLRLADRPGERITPAEIEAQADRWASRRGTPARRGRRSGGRSNFVTYATHWMQFLGRWEPPAAAPRRYADRVASFAEFMRGDMGLSPCTIDFRRRLAQAFLDDLCVSRPLEEVTPTDVDDALARLLNGGRSRASVAAYASALRAFFRFAQDNGWCRRGLAEAIKGPRLFPQGTLPSGPSWDDVRRLLDAAEGDDPASVRDRAILMLLAVYGCRGGEVVRLRLDDLDWEQERIHFTRTKPARTQTYPLSRSVGDAILRYLRQARPRSPRREVFLRLRPPFEPLGRTALWWVVGRRLRALAPSLRHHGPHALRHACATHLLEQGFTLKQIGDHLGHRSPDATRLYAKVDLAGLRAVADFDLGGLA